MYNKTRYRFVWKTTIFLFQNMIIVEKYTIHTIAQVFGCKYYIYYIWITRNYNERMARYIEHLTL